MTTNQQSPRVRWGIPLLLAFLILVAGCNFLDETSDDVTATPSPSPEPHTTPQADEDAEEGGSLVVAIPEEPNSLNFTLASQESANWILSTLNARMIRITHDNEFQPWMLREVPTVENGGISEDGQTYTIRFLPELRWSDGEPLTATDFAFTWQTITSAGYPAPSRDGWNLIEEVTVSSDNLSAVVRLSRASADFVRQVLAGGSGESAGFLLPEHILGDLDPEEIPGHEFGAGSYVGAGPFRLAEWSPGEQIVVERSDEYWNDPPLLDRVVFRFPESPREAITLVTTGDVDLTVELPETALLDAIDSDETEAYITPKAGAVNAFAFNLNDPADLAEPHPIFGDPAVRRAIVMGFDRQHIVETILLEHTEVPGAPLVNTLWERIELPPLPYDPDQAAELLEAAGWELDGDGNRVKGDTQLAFTHTTLAGDDQQAILRQRIQAQFIEDMAELGISVEPQNYTTEQLTGTEDEPGILLERSFDLVDVNWSERSGIDRFAERFGSNAIPEPGTSDGDNVMGYINPDVDRKLIRQATTLAPDEREELLREIQYELREDAPVILVYEHIDIAMARTYIHGLLPGPVTGIWWNVEDWWISTEDVLS